MKTKILPDFQICISVPLSLVLLLLLVCEWVQVGIDLYIPHRKYQVKPHSSAWFSAACAAAIVHRYHFSCLHKDKSSSSKVKFKQTSNCCKRVLEAAELTYPNKNKIDHYFPETWLL